MLSVLKIHDEIKTNRTDLFELILMNKSKLYTSLNFFINQFYINI